MDERSQHDEQVEAALGDLEVAQDVGDEIRGGKADLSEFVIVKSPDKSTPTLSP